MTLRVITGQLCLALILSLFLTGGMEAWALEQETGVPLQDPLSLELQASRSRVYLGETVQVSVTLRATGAPLRNVGYPTVGGSGFGIKSFSLAEERQEERDGESQLSYRFTATITPKQSGALSIGPAELECEEVIPSSGPGAFFGGTENRPLLLRSNAASLEVMPLPAAGRPPGFSGAVGRFSVTRSATPRSVRAGDPVTVRTVIRGTGLLGSTRCEPVSAPGLRGYPPVAANVGNSLSCEQVVVPESAAVRVIPPAEIDFFDPATARYRSSRSAAVPLHVTTPSTTPAPAPPNPAQPAVISIPLSAASAKPEGWLWSTAALCALAAVAAGTLYRRRTVSTAPAALPPSRTDAASPFSGAEATLTRLSAVAEGAGAGGDIDGLYTALFRSLQSCLAQHLKIPAAGITGPLSDGTLPPEVVLDANALLRRCHQVRYGRLRPDESEISHDLQTLHRLISFLGK